MTENQFRSNPDFTSRFRELISDPVMQQAVSIWMESDGILDAPVNSDAIVSVRVLSQLAGGRAKVLHFLSLGEPLQPTPVEPEPDWKNPLEEEQPATA